MAQHSGSGEPRRPRVRRRAGLATGAPPLAPVREGGRDGRRAGARLPLLTDSSTWQANLDGTNPQIIAGQVEALGVAADANHLYWSDNNAGTIWPGNLDGTSPQAIVTGKEAFGVAVSP